MDGIKCKFRDWTIDTGAAPRGRLGRVLHDCVCSLAGASSCCFAKRFGSCSTTCWIRLRSSSLDLLQIVLQTHACQTPTVNSGSRGRIRAHQEPSVTAMNVPTAQLDATNTPALSPRMTPTPAPLAIPLSRLLRAHGISPIFCRSSKKEILCLGRCVSVRSASSRAGGGTHLDGLFDVCPVVSRRICLEEHFLGAWGGWY